MPQSHCQFRCVPQEHTSLCPRCRDQTVENISLAAMLRYSSISQEAQGKGHGTRKWAKIVSIHFSEALNDSTGADFLGQLFFLPFCGIFFSLGAATLRSSLVFDTFPMPIATLARNAGQVSKTGVNCGFEEPVATISLSRSTVKN